MKNKEVILWTIFLCICFFIIGWASNDLYKDLSNKRIYDGLNMRGYNFSEAMAIAYDLDDYGDWVCVNVKGMDFKHAIEVCQHEVGHEMFAKICEKDMEKCFEIVEDE